MAQQPDQFRDFGILPQGVQPPPEHVRCFLSRGRIIGQLIATGIVAALGLGLAVVLLLTMPLPLNLLGTAAALAGFGAFLFLATHNDYYWVELDGKTLRAKHLYTGRVIERSVAEIESLGTMVYQIQSTETAVIQWLVGRIKGVEVRFRDRRTPLRILRADPAMTNAKELIEALLFRMAQVREVDAEIVDFAGKPLVRQIFWKGEKPLTVPSGKNLKVVLCCLIFLALLFGPILGFLGLQVNRRHVLGSVPPQEIALATLIEKGPGTNPHVALTDFRFGGYVKETQSGSWSGVYIALFPTSKTGRDPGEQAPTPTEIKAVFASKTIRNEAALDLLAKQKRITGLCSDAPGLTYGTIRTELIKANQGSSLSSAWEIDELKEPPSAATVRIIFLGSAAFYVLIIALAIVVYKKA